MKIILCVSSHGIFTFMFWGGHGQLYEHHLSCVLSCHRWWQSKCFLSSSLLQPRVAVGFSFGQGDMEENLLGGFWEKLFLPFKGRGMFGWFCFLPFPCSLSLLPDFELEIVRVTCLEPLLPFFNNRGKVKKITENLEPSPHRAIKLTLEPPTYRHLNK